MTRATMELEQLEAEVAALAEELHKVAVKVRAMKRTAREEARVKRLIDGIASYRLATGKGR